jgi:hypothetical protein
MKGNTTLKFSRELEIDNDKFYNNVQYADKIEEFLTISKYYLKYIANTFVNFPYGSASVVEMSRCEENMDNILMSLEYREKSKMKRVGELIRYKQYPIIIFLFKLINSYDLIPNVPSQSTQQIPQSQQLPQGPQNLNEQYKQHLAMMLKKAYLFLLI